MSMSNIILPSTFSISGDRTLRVAVVGETIDLLPVDPRFGYSYALTARPVGSSAAISASTFTPDVAGKYTATITVEGDTRTVTTWAFASSAYAALSSRGNGEQRDDGSRRGIMLAMARTLDDGPLAAFAAGSWPAGLSADLRQFGG